MNVPIIGEGGPESGGSGTGGGGIRNIIGGIKDAADTVQTVQQIFGKDSATQLAKANYKLNKMSTLASVDLAKQQLKTQKDDEERKRKIRNLLLHGNY